MVSIIIPFFNSEKTILDTLNSIKNQTYTNYEVVLVDDGSIDRSLAIVEHFLEENKFLKYTLVKQNNHGVSAARNKALKLAKGKIIAFLDSDDRWYVNTLEKLVEALYQSDYKLIGALRFDRKKNSNGEITEITFNKLLIRNYFTISGVVAYKHVIDSVKGFDIRMKCAEDYKLWLNIARKYKVGILEEKLVIYGEDDVKYKNTGLSSNLKVMEEYQLSIYEELYDQGVINAIQYKLLKGWSTLKYFRRFGIYSLKSKQ